jgi:hypothetical protein
MKSVRLKVKQTVHKHRILFGKVVSLRVYILTILIVLYIYTGSKQLSKWMANDRTRFLNVAVRDYR